MSKFAYGINFEIEHCCNCGMPFAMTREFQQRRLKKRDAFYCPKGHAQHYTGKSQEQRLKEQLARKQRELEAEAGRAIMLENQRDNISKSYNKMRNRVKNGVCPCCNRTFENLLNHMKIKHPDFGNHRILKSIRNAYGLTQSSLAEEIGVTPAYVSLYENEKSLPAYAEQEIDYWIESNT